MSKTKRLKLELDLPDEDDPAPARGKRTQPGRPSRLAWWGSRLTMTAVLLAVLVVFAPTIVSATGMWKSILAWAAPDLAGQINAGSLSLAWWSPIEVRDLVVRDAEDKPLAEVPLVRSQRTLWQLATSPQDLGVFEIHQPLARVLLRADGSNIEDFLAKLPQGDGDSSGSASAIRIGLVLSGGTIELEDTIAGRQWLLEEVALEMNWPTAAGEAKSGKLAARVSAVNGPTVPVRQGQLAAEFTWQPGQSESFALGAGQAEIKLSGLPTELLTGALGRFVADIRPQGALTLDAGYAWNDDGRSQHLVVRELSAPQLVVAAPSFLGNDELAASIAAGQADVLLAGDRLEIKSLRLDSNLVQAAGSGAAALGALASGGSLATAADAADVEVHGQINLAELARQLPGTLRLKDDTQLTGGTGQLSLVSRNEPAGRRWLASLKTDRIEATAAGSPIVLDEPLFIELAARMTEDGPVIDQLIGRASFLALDGRGSLAGGNITASADLDKLVAELGRLIDWRDIQLAGTLGMEIGWSRAVGDVWTARATGRVQNFVAAASGMTPWQERDLQIGADIGGNLTAEGLKEINTATLTVVSAGDRLEAALAEPVKEVTASTSWPLTFTLRGDLATWMPRLQPLVPLADWEFSGAIDGRGSGRFSPAACQLGPTHVEVQQLEVAGPGLWIREPQLVLDTAGTWDQAAMTLELPETVLQSTSLGVRADGLRLVASGPTMTGIIDFRGDPGRLSSWIGGRGQPRSWQIAGTLTGRLEMADRGAAHEATLLADIEKFELLMPQTPPAAPRGESLVSQSGPPAMQVCWSEAKVSLATLVGYDPATGTVNVARSSLKTDWTEVAATGTLSDLAARCLADLSGEISYDLSLVERKIKTDVYPRGKSDDPRQPRSIDTLVLRGQEKRPFILRGPLLGESGALVSDELTAEASLGWQAAQFVGLVAGPADFKAQLKQGTIFLSPLDIPLNEGRLTTAPRILLNDPTPSLVVDRGPLIENVRITPEMCNQWLKYVAPLVADATDAQGKFSLSLEGAAVPIFSPLAMQTEGKLAIHGAQVGPGPLARQYLQTARQLRAMVDPTAAGGDNYGRWLLMPEHDVAFAVRDGIVSHGGLTMTAQNFVLTTQGHVRIEDQAIDIDAKIPVQDAWFKKDQQTIAAKFRGQAIPLKLSGTLSQPKLDSQPLQAFDKQYVGTAVQGLLDKGQKEVQGLLEKEAGKVLVGLDDLLTPKARPKPMPAPVQPSSAPPVP